jgi:hypothetical protein
METAERLFGERLAIGESIGVATQDARKRAFYKEISMPTAQATAPPPTRVLAQIAALQRMDRQKLCEQWEVMMGTPPPGTASSLRQRLIHRVQELAYGGLPPAVKTALEKVAKRDAGETSRPTEKAPTPGTRFLREWRGQRHEVTACEGGFEYMGQKYRSLTAVAKAITNQHTNGQVFFGIRKREGRQ